MSASHALERLWTLDFGHWTISTNTARNLATENPCAAHGLASRPAKEFGADPDDRQKQSRRDQKIRVRASLPCARLQSPSARAHLLRQGRPSTVARDTW